MRMHWFLAFLLVMLELFQQEDKMQVTANSQLRAIQYSKEGKSHSFQESWMKIYRRSRPTMYMDHHIVSVAKPYDDDERPTFNVAIIKRGIHRDDIVCAGVLVSEKHVITIATGCIVKGKKSTPPNELFVRLRTYSPRAFESYNLDYAVKDHAVHSECCNSKYEAQHDIAMLVIYLQVKLDKYVTPAKLPSKWALYVPDRQEFWDLSNLEPFKIPKDFNDAHWLVKVTYVSPTICGNAFKNFMHTMTCTSYQHERGEDNCQADRGSGLSHNKVAIGLLIDKVKCGSSKTAGLYVNVGYNKNWIVSTMNKMK